MFLDIYFGEQLINSSANNSSFLEAFTGSILIYILVVFLFFYLIFLLFFFIKPLISKDPKKYYKKYLEIRGEMQRIDDLYQNKKINFEDYTYAQFNYAKEYEQIINYLCKFPEYKQKLKSYKLAYNKNREKREKELNKHTDKNDFVQKVNFLVGTLLSETKDYTVEEIKQAILDEGFNKDIANQVIVELKHEGAKFAAHIVNKNKKPSKFINFINKLFKTEDYYKNLKNKDHSIEESKKQISSYDKDQTTSIDIKSTIRSKDNNQNKPNFIAQGVTNFSKYNKVKKKDKSLLSKIFKNNRKPKVEEIKDIFDSIDSSLKK
jgi:hypothetical protein